MLKYILYLKCDFHDAGENHFLSPPPRYFIFISVKSAVVVRIIEYISNLQYGFRNGGENHSHHLHRAISSSFLSKARWW